MVQRCHSVSSIPLDEDDEARVRCPEPKVRVMVGQLRNPRPVANFQVFDRQVPVGDRPEEARFGMSAELAINEVARLRNDQRTGDEWPRCRGEKHAANIVVLICSVSGGQQDVGVDNEHSVSAEGLGEHCVRVTR